MQALKQELEQTKPQLRAAQAKAEEKEQELKRLQKLDTKEQAEAAEKFASPRQPPPDSATPECAEKQQWLACAAKNGLLRHAPEELRGDREFMLEAVAQDGRALQYASEELRGTREFMLAAVAQDGRALQYASEELRGDREFMLAAVAQDGYALHFASKELCGDREFVLAALAQNGDALQHASEELREERAFVLEAVEKTRSWFLVNWASPVLGEDKDFLQQCKDVCGTGLVFTYYESFTAFQRMRESFLATGASVPGGQAYERVMEKLRKRGDTGAATVWFDEEPVFGAFADNGGWLHPSDECGRDYKPAPPESPGRHPMWRSKVESCAADFIPEVGSKHPCWCCHWIRKVREHHAAGAVICCTVSNIFFPAWVREYGAGSSELSDQRADELKLPRECFKNGLPEGWGCGKITIAGAGTFEREAPIHPRTGLPLGQGCRWERQALDGMDFPVYVFFTP
ncbi:unnamed protein product [Effrenium voratum]|nr:unnamed protein product [Effrenium voratum]